MPALIIVGGNNGGIVVILWRNGGNKNIGEAIKMNLYKLSKGHRVTSTMTDVTVMENMALRMKTNTKFLPKRSKVLNTSSMTNLVKVFTV